MVKPVKDGLDDADEQGTAKSKADAAGKADLPVKISEVSAVIPPADPPLLFKPDTRHIFQCRAHDAREHKNRHRTPPQSVEQKNQEHTACAIDWQIGPAVDASVDKGVVCDKVEQDFPEPAGKCSCKKKQCVIVKGVYVHFLFHNVLVFVKFVVLFIKDNFLFYLICDILETVK